MVLAVFLAQSEFANRREYSSKVQEEFEQQFGDESLPHRNCVFALIKK